MKTLRIGIASAAEAKARTLAIARGELKAGPGAPKVWFTSTNSFARLLSPANRDLLAIIARHKPNSLAELAEITGRAKSNLSRTLKRLAAMNIVELEKGDRGRLVPHVRYDRIELIVPLARAA